MIGFLASFACISIANASDLSIPKTFEFLAVDGQDIGGWLNTPRNIELTPGQHKIALQYSAAIDDANPRIQEFIKSEPLLITLDVVAGKHYRVVPHSSMKSNPKQFAENPRVEIVSSDGDKANADVALLVKNEQNTWAKVTQSYNAPSKPEVSDMAKLTGETAKTTLQPVTGNAATPAAGMLVYWWNQADQPTRDAFIKQIGQ